MNNNMNRICVANLPPDIRIKDIDDFFRPFGRVVNIDVNNRSNPVYAFVQFDTASNAYNAVRTRHGYDYEGYTLQMRLVESEVIKRREFTPPTPPPPIFNNLDRLCNSGPKNFGSNNHIGGNFSNSSFPSNQNSGWLNNTNGMAQQQNMNYPTNIRQQDIRMRSDSGMPNAIDQFGSTNQNMQQQFRNTNFSNMQHQYDNSNQPNMLLQNMNFPNRLDMVQHSMPYSGNGSSRMQEQYNYNNNSQHQMRTMNYSNNQQHQMGSMDYSNNPQQQMGNMDYSNNSSWKSNSSMNRNYRNNDVDQNVYNNDLRKDTYNSNDNFGRNDFDMYRNGLSMVGNITSNSSMQFAPENVRSMDDRRTPYSREEPTNIPAPVDNTNAALETIGNTIISLLSTNQLDNFQKGGGNFGMSGPNSSLSQTPRNVVSKQQYLKSVYFLRQIKFKRNLTSKDEVSRKYHTQIVKDFETFARESRRLESTSSLADERRDLNVSKEKLEDQLRRKKGQLLRAAKAMNMGKDGPKRLGGAYKKRISLLMTDAGFSDVEARALAVHSLEKLKTLIALKQDYDLANKKTDFMSTNKGSLKKKPKIVVYRNDMKYLKSYQELKISKLSPRIILTLNECVTRMHKYEREEKLPLTGGKFIVLLQKIAKKMQKQNAKHSVAKRSVTATTTAANKSNVEKNENEKGQSKSVEKPIKKNNKTKNITSEKNGNVTDDKRVNKVVKNKEDKNVTEGKQDKKSVAGNSGNDAKKQEKMDKEQTEDTNKKQITST